jgi:hypothetical protein
MKIVGLAGLSSTELGIQIELGGRFVVFQYCISIVVMTFRRPSDVYLVRPGQSAVLKGLPYVFLTLLLGWWGLPWGPIYSLQSLGTNLSGGKDVTAEILQSLTTNGE